MTSLFLDTNIVIDLLNKREPFCFDAVRLFSLAYYKRVRLFVSPMTYATASYLLSKHGAKGVRKHLSDLRRLTEVSPTNENTLMMRLLHNLRILRTLCSIIRPCRPKPKPLLPETVRTSPMPNYL